MEKVASGERGGSFWRGGRATRESEEGKAQNELIPVYTVQYGYNSGTLQSSLMSLSYSSPTTYGERHARHP